MKTRCVLCFGLAFLIFGLTFIHAQEAANDGASKKTRRSPLPFYYGKLGVTDDQRQQLYGVQDEYEARLEALRNQLKALVKERDAKMESLLTPGQKLRLKELQQEAKESEPQRAAETAAESAPE